MWSRVDKATNHYSIRNVYESSPNGFENCHRSILHSGVSKQSRHNVVIANQVYVLKCLPTLIPAATLDCRGFVSHYKYFICKFIQRTYNIFLKEPDTLFRAILWLHWWGIKLTRKINKKYNLYRYRISLERLSDFLGIPLPIMIAKDLM